MSREVQSGEHRTDSELRLRRQPGTGTGPLVPVPGLVVEGIDIDGRLSLVAAGESDRAFREFSVSASERIFGAIE